MQEIRSKLRSWYSENKRDLPWRHTKDAYRIWISEIMLQQTQVAQGLPYYQRFIKQFSTVQDLAAAQEDAVLKLWQGLGYYSRARNLHHAAKQVMQDHNGIFPTEYNQLIKLKGIGDYTAAAVSSFTSGEAKACIDGNVIRVICRLFGIETPYDTSEGKKCIRLMAEELLDPRDSATHNQAIMEFGALQCTPKNPQCENCPLQEKCIAFAKHTVKDLPIKTKKTKIKHLYLYYFVFFDKKNNIIIKQRSNSGIWKNLYEFPLFESDNKQNKSNVLTHINENWQHLNQAQITFSKAYTHILSHRKIEAVFVQIKNLESLPEISQSKTITRSDFEHFPVSRLIERFWEDIAKP